MNLPELKQIPIEKLVVGKYQPRRDFNKDYLQELAESIKAQGLIQPIVVRRLDDTQYEIIAGERRWRASQMAGLLKVNCIVYDYHDEQAAAVSIIENLSRRDLNPIETALGYQRLMHEFDYIQDEVAKACGISRAKVSNGLRLLNLTSAVQIMIQRGELTDGHGKVLAALKPMQQLEFANLVIRNHWSVRRLEEQVKKLTCDKSDKEAFKSINVQALEEQLSRQLATEVVIEPLKKSEGGWLKIRYFDNDTLASVLERAALEFD